MANLKLIRVTGSPFSRNFYGCIGIQTDDHSFKIIKGGELHHQKSYSGNGWRYATLKEITADWCPIYRYWTPEKGDNVIITQDYGDWNGCTAAILEKGDIATDYYRVQREDGSISTFDYTSQMILAPYSETTIKPTIEPTIEPEGEPEKEPEETATTKFKIGDRVKGIGAQSKGYGKLGTIRRIGGNVGVEFDENVAGHALDGCCEDGYGWWVDSFSLELVTESKSKKEFVNIRFLTEQEFKDRSLWIDGHPKAWNYDRLMNKYLGQSVVIPKSNIGSDGTFRYQDWTFKVTDYIVTEEVSSSESIPTPVIDTKAEKRSLKIGDDVIANCGPFNNVLGKIKEIRDSRFGVEFCERRLEGHDLNLKCKTGYGWHYDDHELILTDDSIRKLKSQRPLRRFKAGDKVTYKSRGDDYYFGGDDQGGFVGIVENDGEYQEDKGCYGLRVSTKDSDFCYNMLECEFHEYDGTTITETLHIHKTTTDSFTIQDVAHGTITPVITPTFSGYVDPMYFYKQKPITIKQKPKTKLTII